MLRDTDLALFSQGAVRHNLSVLKIKFWSDVEHINQLCETQSPRWVDLQSRGGGWIQDNGAFGL